MLHNKKAQVAIVAVIILLGLLVLIFYSQKHPYEITMEMGEKQNAMLESYSAAESARQFMKSAAETSAKQALYTLAASGGYSAPPDCGAIDNFIIWKKADGTTCYPDVGGTYLADTFKDLFIQNFDKYQEAYADWLSKTTENYILSYIDYDFSQIETEPIKIKGFPVIDTIEWEVVDDAGHVETIQFIYESAIELANEEFGFSYTADPYFELELPYSVIAFYKPVVEKIESGASSCEQLKDVEGFTCKTELYSTETTKGTKFILTSDKKFYVATENGIIEKNLEIRFALEGM